MDGWREVARGVAEREWEFDAQGAETLNRRLFTISFFQLVDAWLVGAPTVETSVEIKMFRIRSTWSN